MMCAYSLALALPLGHAVVPPASSQLVVANVMVDALDDERPRREHKISSGISRRKNSRQAQGRPKSN
jgi:hypothetical protein